MFTTEHKVHVQKSCMLGQLVVYQDNEDQFVLQLGSASDVLILNYNDIKELSSFFTNHTFFGFQKNNAVLTAKAGKVLDYIDANAVLEEERVSWLDLKTLFRAAKKYLK